MQSTTPIFHSSHSPFNLASNDSYYRWRDAKLKGYPTTVEELIVELRSLDFISDVEKKEIIHFVCI